MITSGQDTKETTAIVATPIPVALIDPSPLNRHSTDSNTDIAELAQTIAENGLLSAISARPSANGRYEIICGERRWRAYRLLERETIPCIIKNLDDAQAQIERIVENFQRRDPSFMEQGEAVAALMKLTDRDVFEVANRLGQSVSWVRRRAKLPNLIPAWRDELAKENTPYYAIRDNVSKLEEVAILPPVTQQTILDASVLRHVKTTKELRDAIAKFFMSLDAKPWTRAWEKKAFSGSGEKRCDACLKRSDRENALFVDPDNPNAEQKMCLDPACWKNKCLSWCKHLLTSNPDMIPIRAGYNFHNDNLDAFFGVKPLSSFDWEDRDETEEREGYAALVGVVVDGPAIGTTKPIWLELPGDNSNEDSDISITHNWRANNAAKYREREALAELIAADIAEYLADIDAHVAIPTAQLVDRQLRAAIWFGISGYADSEEKTASLDDPAWNPLAWAWKQTAEHIARHVAAITAEDIAQLYNSDRNPATDNMTASALATMFAIPLDVIGARATEALYKATHEDQEPDSQDDAGGIDQDDTSETIDSSSGPAAPVIAPNVEALTDPEDTIAVDSVSYLKILAKVQ